MFSSFRNCKSSTWKTISTITYDGLMGAYLMTKDDTYLTKKQVMNTIVWNDISVDKLPIPKGQIVYILENKFFH